MLKNLTNKNSTTEKLKIETTPVVEQSSLRGKKGKILVLGLVMLIVFIGLFSPVRKASAFACTGFDMINSVNTPAGCTSDTPTDITALTATGIDVTHDGALTSTATAAATTAPSGTCTAASGSTFDATLIQCNAQGGTWVAKTPTGKSIFEENLGSCLSGTSWNPFSDGCLKTIFFKLFHGIPAFFLWVSGMFFNVLLSVSLSSDLLRSSFVGQAWGIVRDLSNIFFILILLYIAIKIILGLGGTEVKKMIVNVIIIALLINFSMFFTTVIIDSSNILALIFYNKMTVNTKSSTDTDRPYSGIGGEKDVSGGLVNSFDPTQMVGEDFFTQAKKNPPNPDGTQADDSTEVPLSIILSVILLSGAVMCFAAYVFFVTGIFFLGRLIELWILIIFSPFAFMSWPVPQLSSLQDIGWKAWLDRLLSVAFMAPIFMFFLYFIFMLISNKAVFEGIIPKSTGGTTGMIKLILGAVLPCILICVLLLKAKNYAKKGSGAIGEMVMKGAKIAGGLALGATAGIGAVALRGSVGRVSAAMANSEWARKREAQGKIGSSVFRDITKKVGSGSFDVRGARIGGKTLASATGMKVGEAQKGGFEERKKIQIEKRQKRVKELEVGENEDLKQKLNKTQMDLQGLLGTNAKEIESVDKLIEKKRQEANDANIQFNAAKGTDKEEGARKNLDQANLEVKNANFRKKALVNGDDWTDLKGVENATHHEYGTTGRTIDTNGKSVSIDDLEKRKKTQAQDIKNENIQRRMNFAATGQTKWERAKGFVFSGGAYTKAASEEAAYNIIMETKLDSGTKT